MRFRENVQAASSDLGAKILGLCVAEPRVQYRVERVLVWVVRSVGGEVAHRRTPRRRTVTSLRCTILDKIELIELNAPAVPGLSPLRGMDGGMVEGSERS